MKQVERKGIVLAGGTGTRLYPLTMAVSKQLMPVYDKPMIYYPISILMMAGIRDILIITTPVDEPAFRKLLGDGSGFGLRFTYAVQAEPEGLPQAFTIGEKFLDGAPVCLILGDNLFYGHDLPHTLKKESSQEEGACVFAYPVVNPEAYGVVEFDAEGNCLSLEEKPERPKSNYAIPGLYFFDHEVCEHVRELKPSARGELEITDLHRIYLDQGRLRVCPLSRGTAWLDTGNPDALLEASHFVKIVEERQGLKISCLEEIAFRYGWLGESELMAQADRLGKTDYAGYLRKIPTLNGGKG